MRFNHADLAYKDEPGQELIVCANQREYLWVLSGLKHEGRDNVIARAFGMVTTGLRVNRVTVSASIRTRLPVGSTEVDFDRWFNEQVRTRMLQNAEVVMTK